MENYTTKGRVPSINMELQTKTVTKRGKKLLLEGAMGFSE